MLSVLPTTPLFAPAAASAASAPGWLSPLWLAGVLAGLLRLAFQTRAAADLIKTAGDAAMQWRFNPAMKDGIAVPGHARVSVAFRLKPLDGKEPNKAEESSSNET